MFYTEVIYSFFRVVLIILHFTFVLFIVRHNYISLTFRFLEHDGVPLTWHLRQRLQPAAVLAPLSQPGRGPERSS